MKIQGYFLILAAAVLWGAIGPVARMAFAQGLTPMEVAFWRAVLAWGFFGAHALMTRRVAVCIKDVPALLVFALMGVTLFYGSYQVAVKQGGAALASVLLYTAPAWVALMARLFFGERISGNTRIALLCTIAGVAAVSFSGGDLRSVSAMAVICGLISGFTYALYYIFGACFQSRYTAPTVFFYILPIGALGLLPWVEFGAKNVTAWLCLVSLAFLSTYGAYFFYYAGLRYLDATRAAITATVEPIIAAIVAFFWWDEAFTVQGYIGGGLILVSVVVMGAGHVKPRAARP